jgi:hypothetical protein
VDIFAFYKDALLQDGWAWREHLSMPDEEHFDWVTPDPGTSAYAMTVYAKPGQRGQTNIEIRLRTQIPR